MGNAKAEPWKDGTKGRKESSSCRSKEMRWHLTQEELETFPHHQPRDFNHSIYDHFKHPRTSRGADRRPSRHPESPRRGEASKASPRASPSTQQLMTARNNYAAIFKASKNDPDFHQFLAEYERKKTTNRLRVELAAKRPTYTPAVVIFTMTELSKLTSVPETSLNRLLNSNGVNADVRVGSRMAFSKSLADDIRLWTTALQYASTAQRIANYDGNSPIGIGGSGPSPEERARAIDAANRMKARAAEHLSKILSKQSKPKTTK